MAAALSLVMVVNVIGQKKKWRDMLVRCKRSYLGLGIQIGRRHQMIMIRKSKMSKMSKKKEQMIDSAAKSINFVEPKEGMKQEVKDHHPLLHLVPTPVITVTHNPLYPSSLPPPSPLP